LTRTARAHHARVATPRAYLRHPKPPSTREGLRFTQLTGDAPRGVGWAGVPPATRVVRVVLTVARRPSPPPGLASGGARGIPAHPTPGGESRCKRREISGLTRAR